MEPHLVLVLSLLLAAIALVAMLQWLCSRVRAEDWALFERLGRPGVFASSDLAQAWRLWVWLYQRTDATTLSKGTRSIAAAIRLLAPLYVIALLAMIVRSQTG